MICCDNVVPELSDGQQGCRMHSRDRRTVAGAYGKSFRMVEEAWELADSGKEKLRDDESLPSLQFLPRTFQGWTGVQGPEI